jgi:CRP-like cAMP-binding protein
MKKYYLALEKGLLPKSIYPLEGPVTIGRSSENTIRLTDKMVSRSHARVVFQDMAWTVEDLGSSNGVIIAGERVVRRALRPGEAFQIGETTFRFIEEEVPEGASELFRTKDTFAATVMAQTPLLDRPRSRSESKRIQEALLSTPLFKSLVENERKRLAEAANLHLFQPGEIIIREGDGGRSLFIILDGRVRVFTKDYQGRELQVSILGPDLFFGETSLLTGRPRTSSVVALEESLLSEFSFTSVRRLILRYPQFRDILIKYHLDRVEDTKNKRAAAGVQERRLHPRLRERLPVECTVLHAAELQESVESCTFKARSIDISLAGILLALEGFDPKASPSGSQLSLEILLPPPWGKLSSQARVRRLSPAGQQTSELAADFVDFSETDRKKLEDFLYGEAIVKE